ncbi:MAG: cyclase [Thermomicrobiales bacterium]|nr:cyclase [Thermomicrobiales bacterium]
MPDLPSGTVTFLFTDIEGSTERWEHDRAAMAEAVERHLALIRQAIETHGGRWGRFACGWRCMPEKLSLTTGAIISCPPSTGYSGF